MKWLMFLLLISCSQTTQVKVNLYANKVMDIELSSKDVLPHCTIPRDPAKRNSWLGIYLFYNDRIEWLGEKSQRLPKECEKYKKEIVQLLKESKTVRVIGIEKRDSVKDDELADILKRPSLKSVDGRWTFSRIITNMGCFGWEGCEDPRLVEKDYYTNIYE
jgi:hypothetical protein